MENSNKSNKIKLIVICCFVVFAILYVTGIQIFKGTFSADVSGLTVSCDSSCPDEYEETSRTCKEKQNYDGGGSCLCSFYDGLMDQTVTCSCSGNSGPSCSSEGNVIVNNCSKKTVIEGNIYCTKKSSSPSNCNGTIDSNGNCVGSSSSSKVSSPSDCDKGTYYVDADREESCVSCPAGSYCEGDGFARTCPTGTSSPAGSDEKSDCICKNGTYKNGTSCTTCPIGSYCVSGVKYFCSTGKTTTSEGAASATACDKCDATKGYYDTIGECSSKGQSCHKDDNIGCFTANTESKTVTLTFISNGSTVATRTCTIPANGTSCNAGTAPGAQTKTGYEFTGWGNEGCTTASYGGSYSFSAVTANHTYYACFQETGKTETIDINKCKFSGGFPVTYDETIKNCTYYNIQYTTDQSKTDASTAQACCTGKGYRWVGANYASGYEYCVVCGSSTPSCYSVNGSYGWYTSAPTGGTKVDNSKCSLDPGTTPGNGSGGSTGNGGNGGNGGNTGNGGGTGNTTSNPQTGQILIYIVWVIGLVTVVASVLYYRKIEN